MLIFQKLKTTTTQQQYSNYTATTTQQQTSTTQQNTTIIIITIHFENTTFFCAKLGSDVCPRVENQLSEALHHLTQLLVDQWPLGGCLSMSIGTRFRLDTSNFRLNTSNFHLDTSNFHLSSHVATQQQHNYIVPINNGKVIIGVPTISRWISVSQSMLSSGIIQLLYLIWF